MHTPRCWVGWAGTAHPHVPSSAETTRAFLVHQGAAGGVLLRGDGTEAEEEGLEFGAVLERGGGGRVEDAAQALLLCG